VASPPFELKEATPEDVPNVEGVNLMPTLVLSPAAREKVVGERKLNGPVRVPLPVSNV
jgi:hypothetical protein